MKKYKPVIKKVEVDNEHYYYVNDKFHPSVTKILGETLPTPYALRYWIGEVGNEKAEAKLNSAGDRGSKIHNACEALLFGQTVKLKESFPDKKDQKCIVSFIDWVNEYKPEFKADDIEMIVASTLGFAGTLDMFCHINGEPWIIDFKTSNGVYDSHMLQITAYQHAYYEMTGIMANRGILHLNHRTKKGYSFIDKIEISKKEVVIDDFIKVFEVYKMLNGGVVPEPTNVIEYPESLNLFENEKRLKQVGEALKN